MDGWLRDPILAAVPGLRHAATTRAGGVSAPPFDTLNVGLGSADRPAAVRENRMRVARALGFDALITPYQVHGADVAVVGAGERGRPRADALVTRAPGVLLGVLGADCPGVLMVDASRHALAVAHAGWRGVAAGVVPAALSVLRRTCGSRPEDVYAWIGPAIGSARYEVSDEVVGAVAASLPPSLDLVTARIVHPTRPGHARLALQRAIRCQLESLGVPTGRVACVEACTYDESTRFFSYRRDGARTGRHAMVAGWEA